MGTNSVSVTDDAHITRRNNWYDKNQKVGCGHSGDPDDTGLNFDCGLSLGCEH